MLIRNTLLMLLISNLQSPSIAQPPHLRMMFNSLEYVAPAHMEEPRGGAHYVFLDDEPIELIGLFVNWSDRPLVIPMPNQTAAESVRTVLAVKRGRGREAGSPANLDANDTPFLMQGANRIEVQWGAPITVTPGGSLNVPLVLRTPKLPAGVYELRVSQILLQCEDPCRVHDQGGFFVFEVRAADKLPERLDQLYRRGLRALWRGAPDDADGIIQQMLAQYPTSSAAYELRGKQQAARERWRDAAEAYERAAQLVESGRDSLRRPSEEQGALPWSLRFSAENARKRERR